MCLYHLPGMLAALAEERGEAPVEAEGPAPDSVEESPGQGEFEACV
ncbi:hypothetical protein SAMN05421504_108219 [Amycolatopsis xylanica]|uniref:Uncharacterized protein n=1 Tax=Amycolatopsis xylanica TaxID=589385 RepID=A0A1H3PHP6_9PSEU|nr:hypothetical protein SAMN05421504_108219 [Amycolatopsis xylanica]